MTELSGVGCSEHSPFKQEVIKAFFREHTYICHAIGKRWPTWEYLYLDLFAGPGFLTDYPSIPGSPIIALNAMEGLVPYRALAFEENEETASSLWTRSSGKIAVHYGRFQNTALDAVSLLDARVRRCGLIYADPNKFLPDDTSLIDVLIDLAKHPVTRYCDMLLHVPSKMYKLVAAVHHKDAPCILDHLKRIPKECIKVSERYGIQWDWVFFLLTNYKDQIGTRHGWHDIRTDKGRSLLNRANLTEKQRHNLNLSAWLPGFEV